MLNLYIKRSADDGEWFDREGSQLQIRRTTNEEAEEMAATVSKDSWQRSSPGVKVQTAQKQAVRVWRGSRDVYITPGDDAERLVLIDAGLPESIAVGEAVKIDDYLTDKLKEHILRNEPCWPDLITWINDQSADLRKLAQQHSVKLGKA